MFLDSSTETEQETNYKRPRGRAKKGFCWNSTTGSWEQINGKNPKKNKKELKIQLKKFKKNDRKKYENKKKYERTFRIYI